MLNIYNISTQLQSNTHLPEEEKSFILHWYKLLQQAPSKM